MSDYRFVFIWNVFMPKIGGYIENGGQSELTIGKGLGPSPSMYFSFNVYATSTPDEYILQSQVGGRYWSRDEKAPIPVIGDYETDPAKAQRFVVPLTRGDTLFYSPDRASWLAYEMPVQENSAFLAMYPLKSPRYDGNVRISSWDFNDALTGKGTDAPMIIRADLSFYEFPPGSHLTGLQFGVVNLNWTKLHECFLTDVKFYECSLKNAQLWDTTFNNVTAQGLNLDGANLQAATLENVHFTNVTLIKTNLNDATIKGGDFSKCDLTQLEWSYGVKAISTQSQPIIFNNAKLNFPLINHNWEWMDLRNASIEQLPQPISSASSPLKATGVKLSGVNQNSLKGLTLAHAVFDNAMLDKLDLSRADLTGASLIQASLHGTTLTDVKLPDANLTGAQLGGLGHLFTLNTSFEKNLNAGPNVDAALRDQFKQNGITLSATVSLETLAPGRVWELNDAGNHVIYTIRLETQAVQVLTVYAPASSASLINAYMPNAVLTGANLYGVLATGVHFYGSNARLDGSAILEEAQFNDANLSNVNLTQAQLMGTNLSGSYLFNAKFNKANLTPSANGIPANLANANLQGADFTDAQLFGANLSDAAVAINVPTKNNPNQGGVYLFSLPYAGDKNSLPDYKAELDLAAKQFSLNPNGDEPTLQKYVTALETNKPGILKAPFLKHHFTLSESAQVRTIELGNVWQIVDGQNSFTLWTDSDENGNTELYAAPSLTKTREAFHQNDLTLRWQASTAIDTEGQQWLLDNDSENPQNFSTGYVKFLLKLDGSVLDVYGAALRIMRLGKDNQLEYDTETCNVTKLTLANMNGDTVCPNGSKLSTNQKPGGSQWDTKWLRAITPPRPPTCVPTNNSWCPQQGDK